MAHIMIALSVGSIVTKRSTVKNAWNAYKNAPYEHRRISSKQEKVMDLTDINERIRVDEHSGEKIISNVRLIMGIVLTLSTTGVAIIRYLQGDPWIPWRAHVISGIMLFYSICLFIYVRKAKLLPDTFKYICTTIDMTLISAVIWVSCTYP
jgi:hypothetical protein